MDIAIRKKVFVSACLLGEHCRYDGKIEPSQEIEELFECCLEMGILMIPVCPEVLGKLPVPREPAELRGGRVITKSGSDVTKKFFLGARRVRIMADLFGVRMAIFRQKSPSCGAGLVYDGTFSGRLIEGDGITTARLKLQGVEVVSAEDAWDYFLQRDFKI